MVHLDINAASIIRMETRSGIAEIRRMVMQDSTLMSALVGVETEADLFALVIALGHERGIEITEVELAETIRANRRAWLERWTA